MCGIGGILRTDGKRIPATWLTAIDERIAYRGPDGEGHFRDRVEEDDGRATEIVLVHRRLAVIDLPGGAPPMVSERGRDEGEGLLAVVANGCIYNHRELRDELEAAGHLFETAHSDTEVLLHGYREWGRDLAEHLEGMYAFALWDREARSLVLARDWFGQKPLYLRRGFGGNPNVTAFASDARAIATIAGKPLPRPGEAAAELWGDTYLQLGWNHRGATVYGGDGGDGVALVPPTIVDKIDELMPEKPEETATEADFERLIDEAVGRCLEADVPLGCFLSGGVDSSLVTALAVRRTGHLRTFCVRMPVAPYDESEHAARVAAHLGTEHLTLDVASRPSDDLVHLVRTLGQPFGDSSILPTYWVSRAAREHVTVALSGDGGDELFLGYYRHVNARRICRHERVLRWVPRTLVRGREPTSFRSRVARAAGVAHDLPYRGILALEGLFSRDQVIELLGGLPEREASVEPGFDPMQSLRRADLVDYLPNDLLVKVDTASMAVALEVRAPLLDRSVVRAALAAPTWQLVPKGKRKGLLRSIARRHLPAAIVDRPKRGFAIPIDQWFRTDQGGLRTMMLDHLRSSDPFGPIHLERKPLKRLIDEHLAGRVDHGQRLFALLTLSIWAREFGGG